MSGEPGSSTPLHRPAGLAVELVRRSELWGGAGLDEAPLVAAAQAAWARAGVGAESEVAVVLTDDGEIRALNRTWAGKDRATDVLSFPAGESGHADAGGPLGDIVLAYETVTQDAAQADISLTAHAAHLVVHGMLHILGYDHSTDAEAEQMEALESEVMTALGLHDPYAAAREDA